MCRRMAGAYERRKGWGMQRYRCHKVVEAARVSVIYGKGEILANGVVACSGGDWVLGLEGGQKVKLAAQHKPKIGGYFVLYEDGYTSYSPASTFEAGYTLEKGLEA